MAAPHTVSIDKTRAGIGVGVVVDVEVGVGVEVGDNVGVGVDEGVGVVAGVGVGVGVGFAAYLAVASCGPFIVTVIELRPFCWLVPSSTQWSNVYSFTVGALHVTDLPLSCHPVPGTVTPVTLVVTCSQNCCIQLNSISCGSWTS